MRENELAELLMRMAAEADVDLEPAAEELAATALPSFVDPRAFRRAVVQRLEAHLRAQMEERLQSIRRKFDIDAQPQSASVLPRSSAARPAPPSIPAPAVSPVRAPISMEGLPDLADATMTDLAPVGTESAPEDTVAASDDELPTDATMVWTTRHG